MKTERQKQRAGKKGTHKGRMREQPSVKRGMIVLKVPHNEQGELRIMTWLGFSVAVMRVYVATIGTKNVDVAD